MLSSNLPGDLMMEIMMRLPIKSLLRFKCVAKSWYALITDSSFITKQLEYSNSITKNRCLKLIFQSHRPRKHPPCISLISKDEPYVLHHIELPQILQNDLELIFIYDQCHGIFCLHLVFKGQNEGQLLLWNIGSKEVKVVPAASQRKPEYIDDSIIGFGFDPITKDYKVVRFVKKPWEEEEEEEEEPPVEVYNLSTNSWRTIDVDVPNYELAYPSWSSYLNGFYHWLAFVRNDEIDNNALILSFDFNKEVFRTIQLDPGINLSCVANVAVANDCLACVTAYNWPLKFEIWVMNQYGVESSWTKQLQIQLIM
ncbi:F-box/kelch-repeat protein At3g23880-like [Neltuma alba]|uniref:F-box/kelch-repeat protein At3g23880-like n=1 Tax=Neltuma alba TaxID=207710 RepID=UPI0010A4F524|nr:F-box/kelch-repeat protein At3g23880-like [Prosopis alba]